MVNLKCRVFGGKTAPFPTVRVFRVVRPVATVRVRVEPNPELTRQFGPVANTKQIRSSTMEVSHVQWRSIGRVVFYVCLMYIIWLFDGHSPWYEYTYIELHADSYSCCFWSDGRVLNVHPGSSVWWLHWQCLGGLTGVCILAVCHCVMYRTKCLLFSSILIRSPLAQMFVYPWFVGVE